MDSVSLEIGSSEKGNAEFSGVGESGVGGDASADSSLRDISPKQAFRMPVFFVIATFGFFMNVNQMSYSYFPSYCQSFADALPEIAALSGVIASACMTGQAIGKVILGGLNDRSPHAG